MLRAWLEAHGVTQSKLATRVGVSRGAMSKLVAGRTGPGLGTAHIIELATMFVDEGDDFLVDNVPVAAWFRDKERELIASLDETVRVVRERHEAATDVGIAYGLRRRVRGMEQRMEALIEGLAHSPKPSQTHKTLKEVAVIEGELSVHRQLIEKYS